MTQTVGRKRSYLFVLPWDPHIVSGVNGVVRNLAKAMRERGTLEPVIAIDSWERWAPAKTSDTLQFRFSVWGALSALGALKAIVIGPLQLWYTIRLLKAYDVQAVNFHFPGLAPFGVAVLKRLGLFRGKLVLSYHGTDVAPPQGWMDRLIRRFIFQSADHLIACSNGLAQRMSSEFAIPAASVDVIVNGVDSSIFDGVGKPGTKMPGELPQKFVVNVGAFIPRKNHALLIEALALLKDRYPDLHICIAGADGDARRTVEDAVRAHGLTGRVHLFVGLDQFQVALLMSKAAVCVQPSLAESFPLAVLEASSSGIPVVVSDIPGHRELVCNGRTGRLLPLGQPHAYADAIAEILENPAAAARVASEQQARVRKELTWVSTMQQYEKLVRADAPGELFAKPRK